MKTVASSARPSPMSGFMGTRSAVWFAGVLLALAAGLVYANSLRGVFIFDDQSGIVRNETIRDLHRWRDVLTPPCDEGQTVGGRPLLNLTFAINYAFDQLDVRGYHVLNLLIHVLAGWVLLGVLRRTVLRCNAGWTESTALGFAFSVVLLWSLHPLQTAAVTYVSQRAESLSSLFILVVLYCFIRSLENHAARSWLWLGVAAGWAGVATKETAAMAPLLVLVYDRCFVSESWWQALRRHGRLYAGLAAAWVLSIALLLSTAGRGGTAGFGTEIAWWQYALTQCVAIPHYLRLALWPAPLVLDYGTEIVTSPGKLFLPTLVLLTLMAGTGWAWRRGWRCTAFAGTAFFFLLAPSSSVIPIASQTMAEHRMYLPLAAVVALFTAGLWRMAKGWGLVVALVVACALGAVTVQRNFTYRSARELWSDIVAKRPGNARGWCGLGLVLYRSGEAAEARAHFLESLRLEPNYPLAHFYLARSFADAGQPEEAERHFLETIRLAPKFADVYFYYGNFLSQHREYSRAVQQYETAIQLRPTYGEAETNLGVLLASSGHAEEGWRHLTRAVELLPDSIPLRDAFVESLLAAKHVDDALPHLEALVRLQPGRAEPLTRLASAQIALGRESEARGNLETALRCEPNYEPAQRQWQLLNERSGH